MSAALTPRQRRWLVGGGAALIFFFGATWLVLRDDPPPDDADLLLPEPAPAPPGSTVIELLVEIVAALPAEGHWNLVPERREDGSYPQRWAAGPLDRAEWSDPEIAELDRAHFEEALRQLDRVAEALERDRSGWESLDPSVASPLGIAELVRVVRELAERAFWRRLQGDVAAASRDLDLSLRLANRFLENASSGGLTSSPVCGLHRQVIQRFESLLHDGDLDPDVEARVIGTSPALVPERVTLRRALLREYCRVRASLLHEDRRVGSLPRFTYKPNRTVRRFSAIAREALAELERPPGARKDRSGSTAVSNFALVRRALLHLNSGEIQLHLLPEVLWAGIPLLERSCLEENALRLQLALRRYERLHGFLPADLEALLAGVPELCEIPLDPHSGEPLRYDPVRRILWSVGQDGVDDGAPGWDGALPPEFGTNLGRTPDRIWSVPQAPPSGNGSER